MRKKIVILMILVFSLVVVQIVFVNAKERTVPHVFAYDKSVGDVEVYENETDDKQNLNYVNVRASWREDNPLGCHYADMRKDLYEQMRMEARKALGKKISGLKHGI